MVEIVRPGPGQESVWDYPRPPAMRVCDKRIRIIFDGELLADSISSVCILETSHPPSYYLPACDIDMQLLRPTGRTSFCEWKGMANYYDILKEGKCFSQVAWSYHDPAKDFARLKDYVAFYVQFMDACYVGEEKARPQPGGFYGGWVTSDVTGPFKGEPGTLHW